VPNDTNKKNAKANGLRFFLNMEVRGVEPTPNKAKTGTLADSPHIAPQILHQIERLAALVEGGSE